MSIFQTEVKYATKARKNAYETMKGMREEKRNNSSYLVYHNTTFQKAETKMVEHLLTDETIYTSIEKAEGLYVTRLQENKKKLDALTLIANKLKDEETFLSSRISEETVSNMVQGSEAIEEKYQQRIRPLYPEMYL